MASAGVELFALEVGITLPIVISAELLAFEVGFQAPTLMSAELFALEIGLLLAGPAPVVSGRGYVASNVVLIG